MKKTVAAILSLAVMFSAMPAMVCSAADTAGVIDKHGAKTYLGTASDWGAKWDEDKFTEVTDQSVSYSGDLTIKSGDLKDVTVNGDNSKVTITAGKMNDVEVNGGNSTLTITTGVMDDVDCSGNTTVTNGTIGSIKSEGNLVLNGGTIKRTVECDDQITFGGKLTIGGAVTADKIVASGSAAMTVNDTVTASTSITLTGNYLKADEFIGSGTAEIDFKSFTGKAPKMTNMNKVYVDGSSAVSAGGKLTAGTLSIAQSGEFATVYPIELDELVGPGTLTFDSGDLLIHKEVTGKPLLIFNNTVRSGQMAFKADSGRVETEDALLYDFALDKESSGGYDNFLLKSSITEGVTFSVHEASLTTKSSVIIKTTIKPKLSEFADGTKLKWEFHGDAKSFSKSEDSSKNSCTVTLSNTQPGSYRAKLVAYLVDSKGDRLTDYKSDSCLLTAGIQDTNTTQNSNGTSGITLDTSSVTLGIGNTYWVLAVTDSKTPPVQLSYNSSVAAIGKAAAYSGNGKTGWIYPVTGVAKGAVTIDIGGSKMGVNVAGGTIVVDTSSYTMSPGGKYYIGVKLYGLDKSKLNVHSGSACTTVQYGGRDKNGTELYVVKGNQAGTGSVIFEIIGGGLVTTQINVVNGAKPQGVSGRLVAAG
ncbi:MAG TPA: hypothetical protein VHP54_00280 [Caproiciproducens sp.]|nr:hypothetical protein [Caproiciproducens sp.]